MIFDLPAIFNDLQGKASMMRAGAFLSVLAGCAILVRGAFGFAGDAFAVTPGHALGLVALGLGGKLIQRGTEAKQAMLATTKAQKEE